MASSKAVNRMDSVLQFLNSQFISLQDDEKKYYMEHYKCVIEKLVELMKKEDKLFNSIFQNFYWAGSYYDGLKVGKPEEFDVDVVMKLPINYETVEFVNNDVKPPFMKVKMTAMKQLPQTPLWTEVYRFMEKWTDKDGFLLQSEFRQWMESAVNKALIPLPKVGNASQLDIDGKEYLITLKKTGPAMTLNISFRDIKLDVDLVPVIEFKSSKKWPPPPVRENTIPKRESWLIVPKPNSKITNEYQDTYWRLAFHEQERDMITGNEMGHLKNACRLLKKFRDKNNFKSIASYYIKTMFLWEIEQKNHGAAFWQSSLNNVFLTMLKTMAEKMKLGNIDYFWDKRYNLISGMSEIEKSNVENRINKIIKEIEKKSVEDPTIIANHLLNAEELKRFHLKFPGFPAPSSPVVNVAQPEPLVLVPIIDNTETDGGPSSLENVEKILRSMQVEFILQKKLTQTILNKVTNLQQSVYALSEDNAMLRDELKLCKLRSKMDMPQDSNLLLSFDHDSVHTGSSNEIEDNEFGDCSAANGAIVDSLLSFDNSNCDMVDSLLH